MGDKTDTIVLRAHFVKYYHLTHPIFAKSVYLIETNEIDKSANRTLVPRET